MGRKESVEAPARHPRGAARRKERAIQLRERALRNYDHGEALTFHTTFYRTLLRLSKGFMFCPKCSSLMFPVQGKLHCNSCGYERSFSGKDANDGEGRPVWKEKTRRDPRPR